MMSATVSTLDLEPGMVVRCENRYARQYQSHGVNQVVKIEPDYHSAGGGSVITWRDGDPQFCTVGVPDGVQWVRYVEVA